MAAQQYPVHPYGAITFSERVQLWVAILNTLAATLFSFFTYPFRGSKGAPNLKRHVIYVALNTFINKTTIRQRQYVSPSTTAVYEKFMESEGLKPETFEVMQDCRGHWFGKRSAKKVMIYIHGGGYVSAASDGHIKYLYTLQQSLTKQGHSFAVCVLAYSLTPQAAWPKQLEQACEVIRVLSNDGRQPRDILLGGDSAGGNCVIAVLSHVIHPHPLVKPLKINEPFSAAVLISPWVSFDYNRCLPSYRDNQNGDYLDPSHLKIISNVLVQGGSEPYNEPLTAPSDWWKGLQKAVSDIVIWGGGGEVLLDAIVTFSKQVSKAHSKTTTIIAPGDCHIGPVIDHAFDPRGPQSETSKALESWIAARVEV